MSLGLWFKFLKIEINSRASLALDHQQMPSLSYCAEFAVPQVLEQALDLDHYVELCGSILDDIDIVSMQEENDSDDEEEEARSLVRRTYAMHLAYLFATYVDEELQGYRGAPRNASALSLLRKRLEKHMNDPDVVLAVSALRIEQSKGDEEERLNAHIRSTTSGRDRAVFEIIVAETDTEAAAAVKKFFVDPAMSILQGSVGSFLLLLLLLDAAEGYVPKFVSKQSLCAKGVLR